MNTIYLSLVRGADSPDLIMADTNSYKSFLGSLQAIQRVTSDRVATSGFTSVQYLNSDVIFDSACPTNKMYFLKLCQIFVGPTVHQFPKYILKQFI